MKNELGGSAIHQELRGWRVGNGHIGINRGTVNVNVNVTDTIIWQDHHDRVMQLN